MKKTKNFTFYKVIRTIDKGHKHYTIAERTFTNLKKAVNYMLKYENTSSLIIITTFAENGAIKTLIATNAKEPTEKRPLF